MSEPETSGLDDNLARRALVGLAKFQAALALMIFLPAWSLTWWQGWLYWSIIGTACLVLTLYFLRHDPALVARRLRAGPAAEREATQKLIQSFASIFVCAVFVSSALDHLAGWSTVHLAPVLLGDLGTILGFYVMFLAFRENGFASSIIEVGGGQNVIATGPYALVRHPMYSGALILFFATPLSLGAWWGLVPAVLLAATIVWRLLDEEAYLVRNLPGYADYQRRVRARLVPGLW